MCFIPVISDLNINIQRNIKMSCLLHVAFQNILNLFNFIFVRFN